MRKSLVRLIALGVLSVAVMVALTAYVVSLGDRRRSSTSEESSADVWAFYNARSDTDRSTLTADERGILAILDLRQEVAADGFVGYFSYWGGDIAEEALSALPDILGEEWAEVLREAMRLLGTPYPRDLDVRFEMLLDNDSLGDALNALDQRLHDLEARSDADAILGGALAALHR